MNSRAETLFAVFERRRTLMTRTFLITFGMAIVVAFLLPQKYSSSMEILVRTAPTDIESAADRAEDSVGGRVSEAEVNSEVELLTNHDILEAAVVKNHLNHHSFGFLDGEKDIDTAVRKLSTHLSVTPVRNARVIEVKYSDKTPEQAAAVLRAIEQGYLEEHLRAQSTPGAYEFFSTQTGYYAEVLSQAQRVMAEFSEHEELGDLDQQRSSLLRAIADQSTAQEQTAADIAQLGDEIAKSASLQKKLAKRVVRERTSGPNQYAVDHLTALLAELKNRKVQDENKFKEGDVVLQEVNSEIRVAEENLAEANRVNIGQETTVANPVLQEIESGVATRQIALAGAKAKANTLKIQLDANRRRLKHMTEISARYAELSSLVKQAQDRYLDYSSRQQKARVSEMLDKSRITNVVVAQEPTISRLPERPTIPVNIIIGFVFSLFASAAAALMAEYFDDNFQWVRAQGFSRE